MTESIRSSPGDSNLLSKLQATGHWPPVRPPPSDAAALRITGTGHFLTYECELANAIIEKLYGSEDEVTWLKQQDGEVVVQLLMDKMKST